jgi:flagellar FliL protein
LRPGIVVAVSGMAEDQAGTVTLGAPRVGISNTVAVATAVMLAVGALGAAVWRLDAGTLATWLGVRAGAVTPPTDGALEALDPFIVNLSDEDGRRYIKATIQVAFYDAVAPPEFQRRLPQARDMLLTLLSSKTFADVRTPQGKAVLRDEIVGRLNTVLNEDAVKAVYFTDFIVQ